MAATIDIDAPLSAGIRKSKNLKKNPIKKTSQVIKNKSFGDGTSSGTRKRQGGGLQNTEKLNMVNDSRKVRINISNLAPTVLLDDLRQLIEEFQLLNVSVNFNENRKPVGTGDITLSKRHANLLVEKFSVIDTANISNRVKFSETSKRISNGRARTPEKQRKRTKASGQKKVPRKPSRENKPKKTIEELNAELDVYMEYSN